MIETKTHIQKSNIVISEENTKAVPIPLLLRTIGAMPYGHRLRVWLRFLFYTGCRPSETEKALISNISPSGAIWWFPGKRQKDPRKETLPQDLINEINFMLKNTRCINNRIFSFTGTSATRQFNKFWRPILPEWNNKTNTLTRNGFTEKYKYQISGIRKTFATLWFYKYWQKYNDASAAVLMVSKKMRHSSINLTSYHYIQDCENIQAEKYINLLPHEITTTEAQNQIIDFF